MKKRILIIAFSLIHRDPRVLRQIKLLKDDYDLTVMGFGDLSYKGIEYLPVKQKLDVLQGTGVKPEASKERPTKNVKSAIKGLMLNSMIARVILSPILVAARAIRRILNRYRLNIILLGQYEKFYWRKPFIINAERILAGRKYDLILANDMSALPLAAKKASDCFLLYDAHEYSPEMVGLDAGIDYVFYNRYHTLLCDRYLLKATRVSTVSDMLAKKYKERFLVKNPFIVWNAPDFQDLEPTPIDPNKIRMIHHGNAHSQRRIEDMIKIVMKLDERFECDFILVSELSKKGPAYIESLKELASGVDRIRFLDPVPTEQIPSMLNQYDLGFYFLPLKPFNVKYCLPNKFFEFVQGRLALAIGPSPEMSKMVKKYDLGVVADNLSLEEMADKINSLSADKIASYKENSHRYANELSWDTSGHILKSEIKAILAP